MLRRDLMIGDTPNQAYLYYSFLKHDLIEEVNKTIIFFILKDFLEQHSFRINQAK